MGFGWKKSSGTPKLLGNSKITYHSEMDLRHVPSQTTEVLKSTSFIVSSSSAKRTESMTRKCDTKKELSAKVSGANWPQAVEPPAKQKTSFGNWILNSQKSEKAKIHASTPNLYLESSTAAVVPKYRAIPNPSPPAPTNELQKRYSYLRWDPSSGQWDLQRPAFPITEAKFMDKRLSSTTDLRAIPENAATAKSASQWDLRPVEDHVVRRVPVHSAPIQQQRPVSMSSGLRWESNPSMQAFSHQAPVARIPEVMEEDDGSDLGVEVEDPVHPTIISVSPLTSRSPAVKHDSWESKSSGHDTGYFSNGSAKSLEKKLDNKVGLVYSPEGFYLK